MIIMGGRHLAPILLLRIEQLCWPRLPFVVSFLTAL